MMQELFADPKFILGLIFMAVFVIAMYGIVRWAVSDELDARERASRGKQ